jgi:hypothetical protein
MTVFFTECGCDGTWKNLAVAALTMYFGTSLRRNVVSFCWPFETGKQPRGCVDFWRRDESVSLPGN